MSKPEYTRLIKAMMIASGMDPLFDYDYYENSTAITRANFLNAVSTVFNVERDSYKFMFNNLMYLDTPSETIGYFIDSRSKLIEGLTL